MYSCAQQKVDDINPMTPYLIIYITSIIFAFFSQSNLPKSFQKLLVLLLIFTLSFLLLIRNDAMGTDTENYITIFNSLSGDISSVAALTALSIEPGFLLVAYVFKSIFENNFVVFFCFGIIFYTCYIKTAVKSNLNLVLFIASLFSYTLLYLMSFNILRQCMALAIIFFGVGYIINRSNKKFIISCLLAATFHYSALACLIFIPIYKFRNILYRFWFVIMGIVLATSGFAMVYFSSLNERYESYASGGDMSLPSLTFFSFYLLIFIFSIFGSRVIDPIRRDEFKFYSVIYTIYISLMIFFYISGFINQGLVRFTFYFAWPSVFIIDFALKSIKLKEARYFFNVLAFLFLSFFFVYALSLKGTEFIPFQKNNEINLL